MAYVKIDFLVDEGAYYRAAFINMGLKAPVPHIHVVAHVSAIHYRITYLIYLIYLHIILAYYCQGFWIRRTRIVYPSLFSHEISEIGIGKLTKYLLPFFTQFTVFKMYTNYRGPNLTCLVWLPKHPNTVFVFLNF